MSRRRPKRRGRLRAWAIASGAGALSAAALSIAALSAARAAGPTRAERLPNEGLLGARRHELSTGVVSYVSFREENASFRMGLTFELTPWIAREAQGTRLALFQTWTLGGWGDGRRELITQEAGAKLRLSMFPRDVLDIYPVFAAAWLYDFQGTDHMGIRASVGLGVRMFRALHGELTGEMLHAFGSSVDAGAGQNPTFGMAALVGFDLCSLGNWCDYDSLKQRRDDRTCHLYREANALCREVDAAPARRGALCEAVRDALEPVERVPDPGADSVRSFFAALLEEMAEREALRSGPEGDPAQRVASMARRHDCLTAWRARGRDEERAAARDGEVLAVRRVYAPYPTELKRALGCGQAAACEDVCDEEPHADPRVANTHR